MTGKMKFRNLQRVHVAQKPKPFALMSFGLEKCPLRWSARLKLSPAAHSLLRLEPSGHVYPAAGFVDDVRQEKEAHTVELNLEPSVRHSKFHQQVYGKATEIVPAYVRELLTSYST